MPNILIKCVSLKSQSIDLNKHLVAGIFASMKKSNSLDFLGVKMSPAYMSKLVGV